MRLAAEGHPGRDRGHVRTNFRPPGAPPPALAIRRPPAARSTPPPKIRSRPTASCRHTVASRRPFQAHPSSPHPPSPNPRPPNPRPYRRAPTAFPAKRRPPAPGARPARQKPWTMQSSTHAQIVPISKLYRIPRQSPRRKERRRTAFVVAWRKRAWRGFRREPAAWRLARPGSTRDLPSRRPAGDDGADMGTEAMRGWTAELPLPWRM